MIRYSVYRWVGDGKTDIFLYKRDGLWNTLTMTSGHWKYTIGPEAAIRTGEVFPDLVVEVMDKCT